MRPGFDRYSPYSSRKLRKSAKAALVAALGASSNAKKLTIGLVLT